MNRPWLQTYGDKIPQDINPDAFPSTQALISNSVAKYGDLPAIECFGKTMTYAEFEGQAKAFAAWLQKKAGVKHGDRIALMCPNVFAFPIAMHGIVLAGACQVNVNPLYTPRELAHQLNDAGVETIVVFSGSTPVLAEVMAETPVKNIITVNLGDGAGLDIPSPEVDARIKGATRFADALSEGAGLELTPVELSGDDILFLQYTGGTTGLSKGAVLTHRNLIANTEQFRAMLPEAQVEGGEVVIMALPLYHIFGLMMSIAFSAIGSKIILIPNPRDMAGMIASIKDAKFSVIPGVNTLFQGLSSHPDAKNIDFSNFKVAIGGGAAVIEATSEKWKAHSGSHIKEGYGLSETSPVLCLNPMSVTEFTGTCGLPLPSTEIRLLDDNGDDAAEGEPGEICARGPQVMRGYWNNDEANAASFTKDGFFRTGDVGIFAPGGFVKIVDRKKDMVIVSGFNVFPNEVEATVTACEGVAECACIGVPDPKSGEALRVFVVKSEGSDVTAEKIITHCREDLAGYKVPRQIVFLDELPKSNVGKILRRELRDKN